MSRQSAHEKRKVRAVVIERDGNWCLICLRRGWMVARREAVAIVTGRLPHVPAGSRFLCPGSRLEVDSARKLVHPDGRAGCHTCGHHVPVEHGRFAGHDHTGRRIL